MRYTCATGVNCYAIRATRPANPDPFRTSQEALSAWRNEAQIVRWYPARYNRVPGDLPRAVPQRPPHRLDASPCPGAHENQWHRWRAGEFLSSWPAGQADLFDVPMVRSASHWCCSPCSRPIRLVQTPGQCGSPRARRERGARSTTGAARPPLRPPRTEPSMLGAPPPACSCR